MAKHTCWGGKKIRDIPRNHVLHEETLAVHAKIRNSNAARRDIFDSATLFHIFKETI